MHASAIERAQHAENNLKELVLFFHLVHHGFYSLSHLSGPILYLFFFFQGTILLTGLVVHAFNHSRGRCMWISMSSKPTGFGEDCTIKYQIFNKRTLGFICAHARMHTGMYTHKHTHTYTHKRARQKRTGNACCLSPACFFFLGGGGPDLSQSAAHYFPAKLAGQEY